MRQAPPGNKTLREGNDFYRVENYGEALRCWEKSSSLNNIDAILSAANLYYEGNEKFPRDPAKALKLYKKAAYRFEHTFSQHKIGLMYFHGDGVRQSFDHAHRYFQMATDRGHAGARLALANLYYNGQGVEKNFHLALRYFEEMKDHPKALLGIARLYRDGGFAFPRDEIDATIFYERAYAEGDMDACYELACLYIDGIICEQPNYRMAMHYLSFSSTKEHVESIVRVGIIYYHGYSVEVNIDKAFRHFENALNIDREHGLANYYIAKCYIQKNSGYTPELIIEHYTMASYSHHSEASYMIGKYYETIDIEEAAHWYRIAIADGPNELAKAALLRIKPNTTTVPIERELVRSAQFEPELEQARIAAYAKFYEKERLQAEKERDEMIESKEKERLRTEQESNEKLELKEKEWLKSEQETKKMLELKEKERLRTEQKLELSEKEGLRKEREMKEKLELIEKERLRLEQESKEKDEQIRLLTIEKEKMQQFQMQLVLNMADDRNNSSKRKRDTIDY